MTNGGFRYSGAMVGSPFAAILSDRFGRRIGMFWGGVVIIVGMVIVSTSSTIAQFIVGRFILGLGISIMTVAAPAYAVEISPPHWRGRTTGMHEQIFEPGRHNDGTLTFSLQGSITVAGLGVRFLRLLWSTAATKSTMIILGEFH